MVGTMKRGTKTKSMTFRVPEELYEAMAKVAEQRRSSVSYQLMLATDEWIKKAQRQRVGVLDRVLGDMEAELARQAGDRAGQVAPADR
jgi:predicted transcriptional regulator